jgi:hypothetical protein
VEKAEWGSQTPTPFTVSLDLLDEVRRGLDRLDKEYKDACGVIRARERTERWGVEELERRLVFSRAVAQETALRVQSLIDHGILATVRAPPVRRGHLRGDTPRPSDVDNPRPPGTDYPPEGVVKRELPDEERAIEAAKRPDGEVECAG